jgi:hypothetical protein
MWWFTVLLSPQSTQTGGLAGTVPIENSIPTKIRLSTGAEDGESLGLCVHDCFACHENGKYQLLGRSGSRRRASPASTYIKERSVSGGPSFVAVVQSADLWQRHDRSYFWRLNGSWLGRVLSQREMRSRSVIVIQVRSQGATKRAFLEHDHMVQALPPNGTNHPLDVGSLPRRARRGQNFADAQVSHLVLEVLAEDGIAVAQQVAWELVEGKGLPQLLSRPLRGRVRGHLEVNNTTTVVGQNQKHVQDLETEGGHGEKVDGDQLPEVIVQEGAPSLRRRFAAADHVFAHTGLADVDAEFEQLAVDAGCTPTGIFPAHLADQVSNLAGNDQPSGLAAPHLPGPEPAKAGTRCQATTVSGLTMARAERQSLQRRDSQTHNRRSAGVNLQRFLAERCSTPIWWRRAKFSSSSTAPERNMEDRVPSSDVRMIIGGESG